MRRDNLEALRRLNRQMRADELLPLPVPEPPYRPKPHRIWVADWTVILVNDDQYEIANAYLESADRYDLQGKVMPGLAYNFLSQRVPSNLEPGKQPIQYVVARFERHQVRGMTSRNWHWEGLGEW